MLLGHSETEWLYLVIALLLCTLSSLGFYAFGFQKGYNMRVDEYNTLAKTKTREVPVFITPDKNVPSDKVWVLPTEWK